MIRAAPPVPAQELPLETRTPPHEATLTLPLFSTVNSMSPATRELPVSTKTAPALPAVPEPMRNLPVAPDAV